VIDSPPETLQVATPSRWAHNGLWEVSMVRRRIGILTGGGDVPGLNAVIKSVTYRGSETTSRSSVSAVVGRPSRT